LIDEHVDAPELPERVGDHAIHVGGATDVADERQDTAPESFDLGGQALEALPAESNFLEALLVLVPSPARRHVGRDDIGPGAGKRDRDRAAHPARPGAPRDQHRLALEFAHIATPDGGRLAVAGWPECSP
jgi:hypothetical protein